MTFEEMRHRIENRLDQERYLHVMGVVETASKLALHLNLDEEKLTTAALLHDCAKNLDLQALKKMAAENNIPLSQEDIRVDAVIHARVGAWLARHEFGIKDQDILEAIRVHPTGLPGMNIYARALFVCDFIEPGRKMKKTEKYTKLAWEDFEAAVLSIAAEKNRWVLKKRRMLHQDGIDFYHDQLARYNDNKKHLSD